MWCQNLILTTKTVGNRCLGIYRSKRAKKTPISDSVGGQNQILAQHYNSNYTPITIVKWAQNFILTTKTVKNEIVLINPHSNAQCPPPTYLSTDTLSYIVYTCPFFSAQLCIQDNYAFCSFQ